MSDRRRWEELQTRWVQGDPLDPAEEQERVAFAAHDALARRELEMFAALRARATADGEPVSEKFISAVLEAVELGPRLRLVEAGEGVRSPSRPAERQLARVWGWAVAAACLALVAGIGGAWLASSTKTLKTAGATAHASSAYPNAGQPSLELARAELVLSAGEVRVDNGTARIDRKALDTGQVLATGAGRACLTIEPTIDVCLAEHSEITLESLVASSIRIRVEAGLALASLSRRSPGSSFALLAGDVVAMAHGTTFAARHQSDESEVVVLEGSVEVSRNGVSSEQVGAHSRVLIHSNGQVTERSLVGQAEAESLFTLRATHGIWLSAAFGVLELDSKASALTQASIDGGAALPLPFQGLVGVGRHHVTWRDSVGHEAESAIDVSVGETRRLEAPIVRQLPVASNGLAEKPSPTALLDAARAEVAGGNRRAALALYQKVGGFYPGSPEAHTVLPTIGRLYLELGDAEHALRSFDSYLRHPGALAPEALSGKIRALRALGQRQLEHQAIREYLARYPKGLEAPRLEKRALELESR
ncbi:MAG TPA: FecR domain-containing protein [Polyangiaceae bacterium]|nr:FecR domain-containing protein [Polyangiaceae bacterium]